MYLHSISSAFPDFELTQREAWDLIRETPRISELTDRSRGVLKKVLLGDSGIETRRFVADDPVRLFDLGAGELNDLFEQAAPALAESALAGALERADLRAADIDALLVCTCTGYLCPGISSYVAESMGMQAGTYLQDIVGLGCGAAIPTLRAAEGFLAANPEKTVAVVAVETCSSAFFVADDVGVLISLCLFGDGSNASIWRSTQGSTGYRAENFDTLHIPAEREKIRFINDNGKLRNKLHRCVPELAGKAVHELYGKRSIPSPHVITHTGGRDVIEAIESECSLDLIEESRHVLQNFGNTSSPSVLIALDHYLQGKGGDDQLWLTSFGAGFACHSLELNH